MSTIFLARLLMEEKLGRKLTSNEIVHHIDENPFNDKLDNLEVLTRSEHCITHRGGKTHQVSDKGKLLISRLREEYFTTHPANFLGERHSLETREKMCKAWTKERREAQAERMRQIQARRRSKNAEGC